MMNTLLLPTIALVLLSLPGTRADAQSGFWTRTSGLEGVRVDQFLSSSGNYFVLAEWAVYTSSDAGAHWRRAELGLAPSLPLSMTKDSAGRVYVGGTNGRILRSSDVGVTWERISTLPSPVWGLAVEASGMYASGLETFYKSTDAGATWKRIPFISSSGNEDSVLWVERVLGLQSGAVIAIDTDIPYILDGSSAWFRQTADTHGLRWRDFTDIPDGSWYAATDRGVWRTDDLRGNWTPTALSSGSITRVVGTQRGALIALRGPEILLSADSGVSWESVSTSALAIPPRSIARLEGDQAMVLTAVGLHTLNTSTGAISPENRAPVAGTVPALAVGPDGSLYAATVGQYGRLYRTTDHGAIWYPLPSSPMFRSNAALVVRPNGTLVAIADTGLFVSRDGGSTWQLRGRVSSSTSRLVSGPEGIVLAFGGADTIFLRSTDDGETWSSVHYQPFRPYHINDIVVLADDNMLLATQRTLHRSTDGGATWPELPKPSVNNVSMTVAPEGTVYLLGASSYRSADAGNRWTPITSPFAPIRPTAAAALAGGRLYATYADGGRFSDDNGGTWREVQTDAGDRVVSALAVEGRYLFAGTQGGGVLLHDGTSSVHASALPYDGGMIVSVAPMPAREHIVVDLRLPHAGKPVLKLYDTRGAIAAHHRFEFHEEGTARLELNLAGIPAGVYILHATCGGALCARPIIVDAAATR